MSVRFALTNAATRSFNVVSTTASLADRSLMALDNLAAAGELHSAAYLERTRASLRLTADEQEAIALQDAKHRIATRIIAHNERMADPKYAEAYNSVTFTPAIAAE